jgi:hypothetical protein
VPDDKDIVNVAAVAVYAQAQVHTHEYACTQVYNFGYKCAMEELKKETPWIKPTSK